ncbi:recombinase family protein [Trueperella sp. zg.1013]|nr:recombinase family protein [Trueperella sp. zg.1013]
MSNQKKILEEYAIKNDLDNIIHFTDGGISGTRFDRPGFTLMMEQVNIGNIGTVIVKDIVYNEYLNSPCNLLNDMFDEMLI